MHGIKPTLVLGMLFSVSNREDIMADLRDSVNGEAMSRQMWRLCPYTATGLPGEAVVNALHSEEVNSRLANWSVLLRWEK